MCEFVSKSYSGVLFQLRSYLPYDETILLSDWKVLDDLVFDLCPSLSTEVRMRYNRTYCTLDEEGKAST